MAGLSDTGFEPKTLTEIKEELQAEYKALFGESIDLSDDGPFGQLISIQAEREALLWEAMETVYTQWTPDGATGTNLDNLTAITGTVRDPAEPSTVTAVATGTPTTVLLAGRVASVTGTAVRFASLADATIAAATAWAALTVYTAAQRRTNGGNIYEVVTGGTSAASGGPSGTGTAITDGTVTWKFLGVGTGYVDVAMESEETGPVVAAARTLTVIETPVAGWSSVINNLDAELGANEESDSSLRLKREDELRALGNASVEAIRSALLQIPDVVQATVFENITNVIDVDGIPPHAIECLVQDGADAAIRAAIFATIAGGIEAHGSVSGTVTDSQGFSHTIKFTRPTEVDIHVQVNLIVNSAEYPSDGDTQIEAALVAYGDAQKTGKNVVASALEARCFTVAGVLEAECLIGTAPSPTLRTTIAISLRQLAMFDTSRISVTTTPGTP